MAKKDIDKIIDILKKKNIPHLFFAECDDNSFMTSCSCMTDDVVNYLTALAKSLPPMADAINIAANIINQRDFHKDKPQVLN